MDSVLVTGFTPFGTDTLNPSGLIAERLGGLALPVAADLALEITLAEMARRGSDFVLALGVAAGRSSVCVETLAFNEVGYRIPDHRGNDLQGRISENGPPTLATTLDAFAIVRAIRSRGVPAQMSRDAGRYVCNHYYFHLLTRMPSRALFLHLPRLPEVEAANGGDCSTMSLELSEIAVRATLEFLGLGV